jgi:hypothetical protein
LPSGGSGGVALAMAKVISIDSSMWTSCAKLVHACFREMYWVSPGRKAEPHLPMTGIDVLQADASNLASVLHTLSNNNPDLFREIEAETQKLVPNVHGFRTPVAPNYRGIGGPQTTLSVQEKNTAPNVQFSLDQISWGTRTAIAIITTVLAAPPDAWICIEEPEAHLHPDAQAALADFLLRQSKLKQIFITTHSPVIASYAPLESVWLVRRDEQNDTVIERVTEENVSNVIKELGVRPSYNFDTDAIVFVEGKDDVPVYEEWAKLSGLGGKVQFIDAEGWNNMHYYANIRVTESRRVKVDVFVIFDGDTEWERRDRAIKKQLIEKLNLPEDHILTLDQNEPEGYLLDPVAILKAFPREIRLTKEELEERIAPYRTRRDQKKALDDLFQEFRVGRYNGTLGARIVRAMNETPPLLSQFFKKVETTWMRT